MKLAVNQSKIHYEEKNRNYEEAYKVIKAAKEAEADLIAFPEMSFTGFSMLVDRIGEKEEETIQYIRRLAREYKIAVAFGWVKYDPEQKGEKAQNHYTIVSNKGEVLLDYVKSHPFSFAEEDKEYAPGNQIGFCTINGFMMSVAICYDLRFPELFQAESKKADLIIVPANWPEARREHWKTLLRARAIENQCYIVGINCVGRMNDLDYSGDSLVIHPNGTILLDLKREDGLQMIELHNDVKLVREGFPTKKDRREEYYLKLYQSESSSSPKSNP